LVRTPTDIVGAFVIGHGVARRYRPFAATAQPSRSPPARTRGGWPRVSGVRRHAGGAAQLRRMTLRSAHDSLQISASCSPRIAGLPSPVPGLARLVDGRGILVRQPMPTGSTAAGLLCVSTACPVLLAGRGIDTAATVETDAVKTIYACPLLLQRLDGGADGAHRAGQMRLHGLQCPLQITIAQCFGDTAMLIHDRRHPVGLA